jgi:hypothetical protein
VNFEDHPLTWTTTGGDGIEVYSKQSGDGHGGTRLIWKWRRIHYKTGIELAVSPRWLPRRHKAIWAARRVNPPHPWIPDEDDRPPRSARQQAIHDEALARYAAANR